MASIRQAYQSQRVTKNYRFPYLWVAYPNRLPDSLARLIFSFGLIWSSARCSWWWPSDCGIALVHCPDDFSTACDFTSACDFAASIWRRLQFLRSEEHTSELQS